MRRPSRIGIAGLGVAVLGWGAVLGMLPAGANAASTQASSANYDSTATATMGGLLVPDIQDSGLSVTAVAAPGASNSPQQAGLGIAKVLPTLKSVPALGPVIASALQAANPSGSQLADTVATASHSGTSTACATILSGDCTPSGQAKPLVLRLGLSALTAAAGKAQLPIVSQLPDPLADYSIALTIHGPEATCSAGPAGSGEVKSATSLADVTVDLQDKGKSVLPKGAVPLVRGSALATLLGASKTSPLNSLISALTAATPLTVTVSPGSHSSTASTATASTGRVGLMSGTVNLLDVRSATVTCGRNTVDSDPYIPGPMANHVAGTGANDQPAGLNSTTGFSNLTDEGQSLPLGPSMITLPTLYTPQV